MSDRVPREWLIDTLDNLTESITVGHVGSTSDYYRNDGILFLRTGNLNSGKIDLRDIKYITKEFHDSLRKSRLREGDVLVSRVGYTGNAAIVPANFPESNCANIIIIRANHKVDPKYLHLFINSPVAARQNSSFSVGSAQAVLNIGAIKKLEAIIPPLPEQQKIAKILTSVDEVIEKTQAQIDKLKDLKTGMMQELLTQGVGVDGKPHTEFKDSPVGRIPKGWEVSVLGDRVKLIPGYAFKSTDFVKNGVPLIRMGNLYNNKLDLARAPIYLPESFIKNHARFVVYENDIVFSMTGTSGKEDYGFAVRVPLGTQTSLLNQRVAKVVAGNGVKSNFLLHLMRSRLFLDEIYAVGTGTKQANLSSSNILDVELPFPTLHEQGLIADALDSVDKLIESKSAKMLRLQFTKKALMQDLLTGKVRVAID